MGCINGRMRSASTKSAITLSKSIDLESDEPQRVMVDGDLVGFTPLKMQVLPSAFRIFTPEASGAC